MEVELFDIEGGSPQWQGTAGSSLPSAESTTAPVRAESYTADELFDRHASGDLNAYEFELALRSLQTASVETPKETE